jgi:hypothetical protein
VRWDPNRENEVFFEQSAALYSAYYHVQIITHRPFISSPSRPTPLSFPSIAICTNAARSCSRLAAVQLRRSNFTPPTLQVRSSFSPYHYARTVIVFPLSHQCFSLESYSCSTSGLTSTRDLLRIRARTWKMYTSAWMFLKQARLSEKLTATLCELCYNCSFPDGILQVACGMDL